MESTPHEKSPLSPEQELALSEIAARNDWSREQIELATNNLSPEGQAAMEHMNQQEALADQEVERGLGLTALTAEQQLALDSLAASGADQDRVDSARDRMLSSK